MTDYLIFVLPINVLELIAALAGTFFLKSRKTIDLPTKYLVWFLWYTLISELIGTYATVGYFSEYEYFTFVEGTVFEKNRWIYNIYTLVSTLFFTYYFGYYVQRKALRAILRYLAAFFLISSVVHLLTSEVFFKADSEYTNLAGTFLVFLSVVFFYFELLRSDILLNLKRFLAIYISIGVLVFYLCMTPLTIFSEYFNDENREFVNLQSHLVLYSNVFMYSLFILGFYICSRTRKHS